MNKTRWFQWVIGDKKEQISIFDRVESDDGINYIVFKDGGRIDETLVAPLNEKSLTNKYMAEIDHPDNRWSFKEVWVGRQEEKWELNAEQEKVCIQPLIKGRKTIKLICPKPTAARTSVFGEINQVQAPAKSNVDTSDPVYIMMSKAKKVDNDVEMIMSIALPSKNLYNVAEESFDKGGKKVVEYIIENIDTKDIKDALKVAITQMYEKPNNIFESPGVNVVEKSD